MNDVKAQNHKVKFNFTLKIIFFPQLISNLRNVDCEHIFQPVCALCRHLTDWWLIDLLFELQKLMEKKWSHENQLDWLSLKNWISFSCSVSFWINISLHKINREVKSSMLFTVFYLQLFCTFSKDAFVYCAFKKSGQKIEQSSWHQFSLYDKHKIKLLNCKCCVVWIFPRKNALWCFAFHLRSQSNFQPLSI